MQLSTHVGASSGQTWFLDHLPEIQSWTRAGVTHLRPDQREEATAEVLAAIFKASVSTSRRGVLARITPVLAVVYAERPFRHGRARVVSLCAPAQAPGHKPTGWI